MSRFGFIIFEHAHIYSLASDDLLCGNDEIVAMIVSLK